MKKRWFVIPVAAGLMALVVTGGAIFAHGNGHGPFGGKAGQELTVRVAEILGLEQSVVQSAFHQAVGERLDAALEKILGQLVSSERITQEEADAVLLWQQARPEVAGHLRGIMFRSEEFVQRILDRMVGAERITQEEADQVLAWYQGKPDVVPLSGGFHRSKNPSEQYRGESWGHSRGNFAGEFRERSRGYSRGNFGGRMFRHGMKQRDGGEADTSTFRQNFRGLTPQLSTEGLWQ